MYIVSRVRRPDYVLFAPPGVNRHGKCVCLRLLYGRRLLLRICLRVKGEGERNRVARLLREPRFVCKNGRTCHNFRYTLWRQLLRTVFVGFVASLDRVSYATYPIDSLTKRETCAFVV